MNKNSIIALVVILIVVIIGIYFYMQNQQPKEKPATPNPTNSQVSASYDIQGMTVDILKQGTGEGAKVGDNIVVNYVGTLTDGTKFDSSIDRNQPFPYTLGQGQVIKGWELGLLGMKVGEKRKLTIPPELAYGPNGRPPVIPANATLIFEIDMLSINGK